MAPPSPSWMDDGSSPMIAPTTAAGAETLGAVTGNGSNAGTRRRQRIAPPSAPYERISSSARGSAESRPRRVLMVTGKNVRYAEMTATENQGGKPREPSQTTTIGAIARIGIVWEATT